MLENLTDKLGSALRDLRGVSKLSEQNMGHALKEVRQALLSADVHFKVAREFVASVKEQCIGQEVLKSVTPGQQVIKIIHDELVKMLGEGATELEDKKPLRIMMVGLHGSGKTTSSGKLARYLKNKKKYRPALVACDVYRPAAIEQLETLAKNEGASFYGDREEKDVVKIGKRGLEAAKNADANLIIFDTAGRLQIDEDLINEIKRLKDAVQPDEILLVADAALGQEAVNVAKHFHEAVNCTGLILTKLDGDARGGAALSMKSISNVPIKFMGIGEKSDDFDIFYPERMASRILGMGDVVSLVEKAQENIDQDEAERIAEKMRKSDFNLEDFLSQMQQVKKMGSLGSLVGMMPGMSGVEVGDEEEKKMARNEAVILSMTVQERRTPRLLRGSRLKRIANGSGVQMRDVNALLKQFNQMQKMMKMMRGGKGRKMMKAMKSQMGDMPTGGSDLPSNLPNL
ncbi:MAG: signal recognition particle protein [Verrucomicrobiota bacterium]|nr:signal recognition particle protein [Verrucomicrobiota bacterium]